jgi:hypothetical protein
VKKIIFVLTLFMIFGGICFAQSQDTREYVADTMAKELTVEDLQEMEGDFYFHPGYTDQYSPNIERMRQTYIRELILEGIIPAPAKQPVGVSFPDKVEGQTQPVGDPAATVKQPASPAAPQQPRKLVN